MQGSSATNPPVSNGLNHVSSLIDFWYCINQRIQELEATLYNALQQETVIKFGELLTEKQQEELRTAVEKLRRQMLRKSREYDCQILQERMELLQQAHQVRRGNHTHVVSSQPFFVRTQSELKSKQAAGHEGAWHPAFHLSLTLSFLCMQAHMILACARLFWHILSFKILALSFHPEFCLHSSSFVMKMVIPGYWTGHERNGVNAAGLCGTGELSVFPDTTCPSQVGICTFHC